MLEVRVATRQDADAICDAHVAAWRVGYRHVFPSDYLDSGSFEAERRERWRAWEMFWPNSEAYVPVLDGRVVGFATAGPEKLGDDEWSTERGEVYGFYLHPDAWGTGAAAVLMTRAEDYLRSLGFPSAVLWVLEDNPRARGFYEKAGWTFTGEVSTFERDGIRVPDVQYGRALTVEREGRRKVSSLPS